MSSANVAIVRAMHEAFERGDYETSTAAIESVHEWDMRESGLADARLYTGKEGALEFLRTWMGTWEDFEFEGTEYLDGGDQVVVIFTQRGRGKGSGIEMEQEYFGVYELEDGKIVRYRGFATREDALKAAGLT